MNGRDLPSLSIEVPPIDRGGNIGRDVGKKAAKASIPATTVTAMALSKSTPSPHENINAKICTKII